MEWKDEELNPLDESEYESGVDGDFLLFKKYKEDTKDGVFQLLFKLLKSPKLTIYIVAVVVVIGCAKIHAKGLWDLFKWWWVV